MADGTGQGRLTVRASLAGGGTGAAVPPPGIEALRLGRSGRAWVRVPGTPERPAAAPVLVALHGAGGSASDMLALIGDVADRHGVLVLAPQSTRGTWDVILGGYGPDVRLIDAALSALLAGYLVDPARLAICGFSDGASYAGSLGIANGDVFGHVL